MGRKKGGEGPRAEMWPRAPSNLKTSLPVSWHFTHLSIIALPSRENATENK